MSSSEDQLRTVIDTIPTLVWSAKADGAADFFNRRWLDDTGLSARICHGQLRGLKGGRDQRTDSTKSRRSSS